MFDHFSKDAKDLIKHLLVFNPTKRYNFKKIIKHNFFSGINWENLEKKLVEPPFIPEVENSNICKYFISENEINQSINEKNNRNFLLSESSNISNIKTIESSEFIENNKEEKDDINFYLNYDLNNTNLMKKRHNNSLNDINNYSDFYYSNSINNNDILKFAICH